MSWILLTMRKLRLCRLRKSRCGRPPKCGHLQRTAGSAGVRRIACAGDEPPGEEQSAARLESIDIHAGHVVEERTRVSLSELKVRIQSISNIHERLYRSSEVESVELDDDLRDLGGDVFRSFLRVNSNIELKTDLQPVPVGVSIALPLGLTVTELIMNTLKYAFPDGSDGIVTVGLRAAEQEGVLRVTDTGIGFDPEIVRAAGFGLVLVRSLTSQINGSAALESRPGHNEWVIGFPLQWASIPDLPPAETVPIFPVCT